MVNFTLMTRASSNSPRGKDAAARSCLILPDDPWLEAEAWLACGASALLLDLREPRAGALAFLRRAREFGPRPALYARLGPVEHPGFDLALESMLQAPPDGIFLDEAEGGASVQHLAAKLAVFEARAGLADGAMTIIASAAGTPAAIFALGSYKGCSPRLAALSWESGALARALMLDGWPGVVPAPLAVARGLLVLGAAAAGLPALDAPSLHPNEPAEFREECLLARADGFEGKLATRPEEIAIIEEIFAAR
jgi:citrate lyase subunit beta / citryl-CoA lyase